MLNSEVSVVALLFALLLTILLFVDSLFCEDLISKPAVSPIINTLAIADIFSQSGITLGVAELLSNCFSMFCQTLASGWTSKSLNFS